MQKLSILLSCFLFQICLAQKSEISLNYRFGISTNRIALVDPDIDTHLDYGQIRTSWDQGLNLNYSYLLWKKFGLYGTIGIDFSESKHSLPVLNGYGGYHLANIEVRQSRFAYRLGLFKRFSFYDRKVSLDIGAQVVDRFYFSKQVAYVQSETQSHLDWLTYDYNLTAYYGQYFMNPNQIRNNSYLYLNMEYFIRLGFTLKHNFRLNLNFEYARNNIFFYDFNYRVYEYLGGSATPTSVYQNSGIDSPFKFGVRDHFLYAGCGLTYTFQRKVKGE